MEREELARITAEQELASAFGPSGGAGRMQLGSILKADVLILLRRIDDTTHEIVVCETARGLRLAVAKIGDKQQPVPEAAGEAALLEPIVLAGVRKGLSPVREVATVPAFFSKDLTYRHEQLKAVYATLVEQVMLQHEGLVLVELDEARAVAREVAIAGQENILRPLPLFVMGEFRHQGSDAELHVTLKVTISRGERQVDQITLQPLAPGDAPGALRQTVAKALAELIGAPPPPPQPKVEAQQLAERGRAFMQIGHGGEAMPLFEASLLLDEDISVRRDAMTVSGSATFAAEGDNDVELVRRRIANYHRGMEHLEVLTRTLPNLRTPGLKQDLEAIWSFGYRLEFKRSPRLSKDAADEAEAGEKAAREYWFALAERRLRDGRGDEAIWVNRALSNVDDKAHFAAALILIDRWKDLPGNASRIPEIATHGCSMDILNEPAGKDFLDKLAGIDNDDVRQVAAGLKQKTAQYIAGQEREKQAFQEREKQRRETEKTSTEKPEILFTPLALTFPFGTKSTPLNKCDGWLRAGEVDLVWKYSHLLIMREKGTLAVLWRAGEPNTRVDSVTFDGKYVWFSLICHPNPPRLLLADPQTAKSWEITTADGLPVEKLDAKQLTPIAQRMEVGAIAPGKVCVGGSFGRSWLAIIEHDPLRDTKAKPTVKVFHEARDQYRGDPLTWRNTDVAVPFKGMWTLTEPNPAKASPPRQRMVIGREAFHDHPLLVDLQTLQVTVPTETIFVPMRVVDDGLVTRAAIHWLDRSPRSERKKYLQQVMTFSWPDLAVKAEGVDVETGPGMSFGNRAFLLDGRVFIPARTWWVADGLDRPFRALQGRVPDYDITKRIMVGGEDFEKIPNEDTEQIEMLALSCHYGVVCMSRKRVGATIYHVTFPGLSTK